MYNESKEIVVSKGYERENNYNTGKLNNDKKRSINKEKIINKNKGKQLND